VTAESVTAGGTVDVRIPATFYEDHVSRGLPAGELLRSNHRHVYVRVTADELAEWRSDAGYYASWEGSDYRENRAVCDSARRAVVSLRRAEATR
jgi:hypothetical protein